MLQFFKIIFSCILMVLFYLYMCMVHDKSGDTHFCVYSTLLQKNMVIFPKINHLHMISYDVMLFFDDVVILK